MGASASGIGASGRQDLSRLFAHGRVLVDIDQASNALGVDRKDASKKLAALASKGWLRRVTRGLYLAVPAEVAHTDNWSVDPWYLATVVWSPCYVTGWSAANHWSLTDQVFRSTVVATSGRVRRREDELAGHDFVVRHVGEDALAWGLRTEWRQGSRVSIADPGKAVAEMLDVPSLGGGVRHLSEIVESYVLEGHDSNSLAEGLRRVGNGAAFKRLGYLLTVLGLEDDVLVAACREHVTSGFSRLDPDGPTGGRRSHEWNMVLNVELDT